MTSRRFYYYFRPYLSWSWRIALRRLQVGRKRQAARGVWPINEIAGQKPPGWPGWSDGKKFAVVLTHDVEGVLGRDRCLPLMKLEQESGFRSSFNLIPAGSYEV